jgi:hypothetical protein
VRYEDLHAAPEEELRKVLQWLGFSDVTDAQIASAVAGSSIEKMRGLDSKLGPVFFRRGQVGASSGAFSREEQEYVGVLLRPYLAELDYTPIGFKPVA